MIKNRVGIMFLAALFLSAVNTESVFAQAKAKKSSASASAIPSTTRAKVLGKPGTVVYVVDPNKPPELTAISAEKAAMEALSRTCTFGDIYSDFYLSPGNLKYTRKSGSYSVEYHDIPVDSISAEVYSSDFRKIGPVYYFKSPHYCREVVFNRPGWSRDNLYLEDHVLAWKDLEDARRFADAVYVLKLAKEGKACFNYLERGSKRLAASDIDGARADALAYIQENPKLSLIFDESNAIKIYDFCKAGDCSGAIEAALSEADSAQRNNDAARAFKAYSRAYALMTEKDQGAAQVKERLIALYSKLPEKPALPEACRRLRVQAEAKIKEPNYGAAMKLLEKLLEIAPWWPEGHYNVALLSVQLKPVKAENLIITVPLQPKNYQYAIEHMKTYLMLEPGSGNARTAQDKIYEWEMKAGN